MISLRYYQHEAIEAFYAYFQKADGNPIIAMPTGTGKSVVIAEMLRSIFAHFPDQRVLMLTHVKELIDQNYDKLMKVWPMAPAGIYSAGLGRREIRPITFGGIASLVKKAAEIGHVDLVFIDECHLVSPHEETNYRNLLGDLMAINPALKVVGLTATPYRLGQGKLTEPVVSKKQILPPLFTDICYDLTTMEAFNRLVAEGYLCRLVPKRTSEELDVSNVHIQGGEFVLAELQATVDRNEVTRRAIDETMRAATGRFKWLVFATGIEHAEHVAEALRNRGIAAGAVHSKMPAKERDAAVKWFRAPPNGEVRCLVNNGVFTTGFDCPELDLIVMLRPTTSPGLWVQMLGRGTRPAPGKTDCLVLDFAGNTKRLGPINDPVLPRRKGSKGGGTAPVKCCEACGTYVHASLRTCPHCGQEFPRAVKFNGTASTMELMRDADAPVVEVFEVKHVSIEQYKARNSDKPPCLRVVYACKGDIRMFSEFVCLQHQGFAGHKARQWWRERSQFTPPATVEEALKRLQELDTPTHVRVWLNAKHPQVMAADFTGNAFGTTQNSGLPEKNLPF